MAFIINGTNMTPVEVDHKFNRSTSPTMSEAPTDVSVSGSPQSTSPASVTNAPWSTSTVEAAPWNQRKPVVTREMAIKARYEAHMRAAQVHRRAAGQAMAAARAASTEARYEAHMRAAPVHRRAAAQAMAAARAASTEAGYEAHRRAAQVHRRAAAQAMAAAGAASTVSMVPQGLALPGNQPSPTPRPRALPCNSPLPPASRPVRPLPCPLYSHVQIAGYYVRNEKGEVQQETMLDNGIKLRKPTLAWNHGYIHQAHKFSDGPFRPSDKHLAKRKARSTPY